MVARLEKLSTNLDEGKDVLDDVVLAARGQEHETNAGSLARVPFVLVVEFLLLGQRLQQDRNDVLQDEKKDA